MTTAHRTRSCRALIGAAALTAAALVLSACSDTTTSPGADGGSETLTIGIAGTPVLNYAQSGLGGESVYMWQAVHDTLLKIDPDGTVVPNAAESFELNEDATSTSLTLHEGMTFTDGSPVDAEAVKASIENIRDAAGPDASRLSGVEVTVVDDLSVTVTTPEPRGLMPMYLALSMGAIANPAAIGSADADTNPQGSGPYILNTAETASGSAYVLDRNPDYWNPDAYPYDKVVLRVLPDQTARISALRTGQIDATSVDSSSLSQFDQNEYNFVESDVVIEGMMFFDRAGATVPALGDVRVRQAINMAFDREAIVKNLYQEWAIPTAQAFNVSSELFDESYNEMYPYDLDAARALMEEAGYADGFDVTIPNIPGFNRANPMVVQQLGEIGIRVAQEDLPLTSVLSDLIGGKYALAIFPMESRTALWDLANVVAPDSVWNVYHNQTPELDALLADAQSASGAEADEIFGEIGKIMAEEAWFAPWANATSVAVLAPDTSAAPTVGNSVPFLYNFAPTAG